MTFDPSQTPPPPPPKNRTMLYVGLGVGCVALPLVLAAMAGFAYFIFFARKVQKEAAPPRVVYAEPPLAPDSVPQPEVPARAPVPAPAPPRLAQKPAPHDTAIFVNRKEGLDAFLTKTYFEAVFAYPKGWTMEEEVRGKGRGFIRVTRKTSPELPHAENFQLGAWQRDPSVDDGEMIQRVAQRISTAMKGSMKEFREWPLQPARVGMYEATEWRFEGKDEEVPLWGRILFLAPQNRSQASAPLLTLIAGGSTSPEVRSAAEVGVKGELPLMLNTLRWGTDYAGAGQKIRAAAESGGGAIVFTLLDVNDDGRLDGLELLGNRLRRFDQNGDGVVSREEYVAANPSNAPATPEPPAAPAPAPAPSRPAPTAERSLPAGNTLNDAKKLEMVATTLEGFQAGIRTGSFRRFYETYLSNLWKKQITADAFEKAFAAFIKAKVELDPAAFREAPVFSDDRKEGQVVKFAGSYDIRTSDGKAKVNWKLDYIYESGRGWGLTQVNIQTQPYREL